MNITSLLIRAVLLAIFVLGLSAVVFNPTRHSAAIVTHRAAVGSTARDIVELPTVSVRPTIAEIAEAQLSDEVHAMSDEATSARPHLSRTAAPTLPSLGLDMPYYSFGKALPRVSKE